MASIRCTYGQRVATITLEHGFNERTPAEQRHALVHELIHCHLDPIEVPVRQGQAVWRLLGDSAADVLHDQIRHAIEHAVDALTYTLTPRFEEP